MVTRYAHFVPVQKTKQLAHLPARSSDDISHALQELNSIYSTKCSATAHKQPSPLSMPPRCVVALRAALPSLRHASRHPTWAEHCSWKSAPRAPPRQGSKRADARRADTHAHAHTHEVQFFFASLRVGTTCMRGDVTELYCNRHTALNHTRTPHLGPTPTRGPLAHPVVCVDVGF